MVDQAHGINPPIAAAKRRIRCEIDYAGPVRSEHGLRGPVDPPGICGTELDGDPMVGLQPLDHDVHWLVQQGGAGRDDDSHLLASGASGQRADCQDERTQQS